MLPIASQVISTHLSQTYKTPTTALVAVPQRPSRGLAVIYDGLGISMTNREKSALRH